MDQDNYKNKGRITMGLFLVAAGVLLFAYKMGAPVPYWLFTWPVVLIAFGVVISIKHNFKNLGGIILILIGGLNLIDLFNPALNFHNYSVPVIIVGLGLLFIFRPSQSFRHERGRHGRRWMGRETDNLDSTTNFANDEKKNDDSDHIDSISVFGGVKRNILSKNFKGGEITCFMGGAEFNLLQADIQGQVVLEVTQVFGGTKLIIPANWHVKTEVITVFGGIEDKRPVQPGNINYDKVLLLVGTTVFGGIDIRSY